MITEIVVAAAGTLTGGYGLSVYTVALIASARPRRSCCSSGLVPIF